MSGPRQLLLPIAATAVALSLVVRGFGAAGDPIITVIALGYVAIAAATWWRPASPLLAAIWLTTPLVLLFTPSGRELSFSLSAPDSSVWAIHALILLGVGGAVAAAAFAVLIRSRSDDDAAGASAWAMTLALVAFGAVATITPAWLQRPDVATELDDVDLTIELIDTAFTPNLIELPANTQVAVRLENTGELPHTLTIDTIGLDAYVPAGRWTVIEFETPSADAAVYCAIGDHADLGMQAVLRVSS